MIIVLCSLYDATDEVLISNNLPTSIGEYVGHDLDNYPVDTIFSSLDYSISDIVYSRTTNFAYYLAYFSNQLYDSIQGTYHSIRLCRQNNPDDYYIEYNPDKYGYFNALICVNSVTTVIRGFLFRHRIEPAVYSFESILFSNANSVEQFNPLTGGNVYIGSVELVNNSGIKSPDTTPYKLYSDLPDLYRFGLDSPVYSFDWHERYSVAVTHKVYEYVLSDDHSTPYICAVVTYPENPQPWSTDIFVLFMSVKPFTIYYRKVDVNTGTYQEWATASSYNSQNHWYYVEDWDSSQALNMVYSYTPVIQTSDAFISAAAMSIKMIDRYNIRLEANFNYRELFYPYLAIEYVPIDRTTPDIPPSDVDPEDIPPEDEPPKPIPSDEPDPYYDPTSDPKSPEYDPVKDPTSPSYDPSVPATPYKPPAQPTILEMPVIQPTPAVIPTPETPPSYVTTNDLFTLYNPSGGDLTSIANFLWSPAWSVDTFKKIFANPLDCILGLLVLPHLNATVATKTMNIGNISTGISLHYFTSQFFDFDCGTFALPEYYQSYLDYSPYTKISIFLPYIGDQELNTDEVMGKNIGVKYRFDLATGDCIAFISIDGDVLYSFAGNCAARLPLSANNYAGIIPAITTAAIRASTIPSAISAIGAASALAVTAMKQSASHTGSLSGSAGLMGIQTPYLIVTRPRQALPLAQNSFKGYPSFITESLSQLSGYTEVDQVHLEHVPATADELIEIERLLKEGVLF